MSIILFSKNKKLFLISTTGLHFTKSKIISLFHYRIAFIKIRNYFILSIAPIYRYSIPIMVKPCAGAVGPAALLSFFSKISSL